METAGLFLDEFFRALLAADGEVDMAAARARGKVRDRGDYWMPVLFMRLRTGRLWYRHGMQARAGFAKWEGLLANLREGKCTPIVGSGLVELLFGSARELARRWADTHRFPMAPHERESLPQVAQFLAVNHGTAFPAAELKAYLRRELLRRHGRKLPEGRDPHRAPLEQLISDVGARLRQANPLEPHRVLASLPCPVYFTTNHDNLLADALKDAGRDPQVELCRWNEGAAGGGDADEEDEADRPPSVFDDRAYRPSAERPLVYHLFGHLREKEPETLVLSEDNYFDYLIGVTKNRVVIPKVVRKVLADSALLFLGFQMDDWSFRVLFRHVMTLEGGKRRNNPKYHHVAVQIDPEGGRIIEPELARRYLESFFRNTNINIYWGKVEDFIAELARLWQDQQPPGDLSPREVTHA
jgi:hypothetical protein